MEGKKERWMHTLAKSAIIALANARKRGAAGAHLPTPWLFEPAKRPDDRTDY